MGTVIAIIIIVAIWVIYNADHNSRFNNYPTDKVDTYKMVTDKIKYNLSDKQVQRNMINGKYDKK